MTWLVAIAEQARHSLAEKSLEALDFVPFVPRYSDSIVRCCRRVNVERPLFGRYFFVEMNENWRRVSSARGVWDVLLGPEETPLLVKDHVIDEIKSFSAQELKLGFWKGQRVIPQSGHLCGVEGIFQNLTSRGREVALFNILGVETKVEFAPGVLRKAFDNDLPKMKRRRKGKVRYVVSGCHENHHETSIGQ